VADVVHHVAAGMRLRRYLMKIGDLVKVETKYYGTKIGLIVEHGPNGYLVHSPDHSRMIRACAQDVKVVLK